MQFIIDNSQFSNKKQKAKTRALKLLSTGQAKTKTNRILYNQFYRAVCIVALFLMAIFLIPSRDSFATSQSDLDRIQNDINKKNNDLSIKQKESKAIEGEISTFNGQISDVQSQINSTQSQIDSLNAQINDANKKITEFEADLKIKKESLAEYLRVFYEDSNISTIEQIATSDSFSDFVDKTEYNLTMQEKIKETSGEIKKLKKNLEDNKVQIAKQVQEIEGLKKQQIAQRQTLDGQRSVKQSLLKVTKGQESEYKKILNDLQKEYNSAMNSAWTNAGTGSSGNSGGNDTGGGGDGGVVSGNRFNRGDIIGYQGNSGFSTGNHLHFEVRVSPLSSPINPWGYLNSGQLLFPTSPAGVNQDYGCQEYNHNGTCAYFHTGIDFTGGYAGAPIRAAESGTIYYKETGWGNTYDKWLSCYNAGGGSSCDKYIVYGNYIIIKHDNGLYTLYGHLN